MTNQDDSVETQSHPLDADKSLPRDDDLEAELYRLRFEMDGILLFSPLTEMIPWPVLGPEIARFLESLRQARRRIVSEQA